MIKLPREEELDPGEVLAPLRRHDFMNGARFTLAEVQRLNATAQPVSDGWINCRDSLPHNETGLWSTPVAAISDLGDVFQLSCMNGYWQRTKDFVESGASEIVYWMYLPTGLNKKLSRVRNENR